MDSEERRQTVTRFWDRVQEVLGLLPLRVMGLLDLFELSASQIIANAETDWAACIEKEVKAKGDAMFENAVRRGFTRQKCDVFGLEHSDLGTFSLFPGEKVAIEDLRKLIQANGIRSYITDSSVQPVRRRGAGTIQADVVPTPGQLKKILLYKLANYYRKHRSLGINGNFFLNLPVVTLSEANNKMTVRVPCVKCDQPPKCDYNGTSWLTNNYYQHVRTHLRREAEARSSRRSGARRLRRPGRRRSNIPGTGQRRRLTSGSVNQEAEGGEEDLQGAPTPVHTDEERDEQSPTLNASRDQPTQSVPSDTDRERCEDAQQEASSEEPRDSVEDRSAGQAAGSGGGGGCQSSSRKSVTELIEQFSGEGTSKQYDLRNRDVTEN